LLGRLNHQPSLQIATPGVAGEWLQGRLVSPAAPAVPFVGAAGVWAPEHATVGVAPSPAAPTKNLSRC